MNIQQLGLCAVATISMFGAAGCGGSSSTGATTVLSPRSVTTALSNGLTGTLTESQSTIFVGGSVTYTMTLTNSTTQPITFLPVNSGVSLATVPATLGVSDPSGAAIYPTGAVAQFIGTGAAVTLAPGQSVSGSQSVGTTGNGSYSVTGQYTAKALFAVVPGTMSSVNNAILATAGPLPLTVH